MNEENKDTNLERFKDFSSWKVETAEEQEAKKLFKEEEIR